MHEDQAGLSAPPSLEPAYFLPAYAVTSSVTATTVNSGFVHAIEDSFFQCVTWKGTTGGLYRVGECLQLPQWGYAHRVPQLDNGCGRLVRFGQKLHYWRSLAIGAH